ncbi:14-alpha sterol demethylase Cyp51A [Amylocarpus encephaloides]|uniref:14-alpha sterol demethylase Cyp51A n=1 Tax=Amylocarpus encephaloides TaxID=45428 RepID=A0A9P7YIQ3_9HELO|nr:14-alpha sterol demethylase Cyp51A [Amylocarpus encephaloides]
MESVWVVPLLPAVISNSALSVPRFPIYLSGLVVAFVILNVLWQQLPSQKSEPPLVFHWFPFIGNAFSYGTDPFNFYVECRRKHGDIFTFILFGKKMTVYLGVNGNDFILNGRLQDLNAEEIYSPLTTPVFGNDVVYDCPNSKLMEQKKFIKFGLTQTALESHVLLIEKEVIDYIKTSSSWKGRSGTVHIPSAMAEITIFTAARSLQGLEVRRKLTAEFAELYDDLDGGFRPINFLMPWAPLRQNRRRDAAREKMASIYMDLITARRQRYTQVEDEEPDMISNLMRCTYKDGNPIPDKEIANIMITLLMAGQHSSSSSGSWIMLRLASRPDISEELYQEQVRVSMHGSTFSPLQYSDIDKFPMLKNVLKETLRVHSSIHSLMRKVKNPMPVPGSDYVITPDKVLLASPIVTHLSEMYFSNPLVWDPHRWDDASEEEAASKADDGTSSISAGTRSPYLPFGVGRHRCVGEKFAYVNLCTIIATLVREFKFRTLDGTTKVPPTDYTSLFSRPGQPAEIRWEKRVVETVLSLESVSARYKVLLE